MTNLVGKAILQKPGNFDVSVLVPASVQGQPNGDRDACVNMQAGSNCFAGSGDTGWPTARLEGLTFEELESRYQKLK